MFSVTTVETGELFVLPEVQRTIDEWRGPISKPLMMGFVRTGETVMTAVASLGVGIDGEHLLCLAFGSTDVHYVGELRVCAYAKEPSEPEGSGWLSLPMFRDEPPSDEAAIVAGELRLRGQRTRNADGSMRIMLSVNPAREDQDQLRGWVPV
jgi:hypothetical protein